MYLTKQKNGSYIPTYAKDHEASAKIKIGDEIYGTQQRNIDFHRKCMALFQLGFENQDKVENFDIYRYITTMKAGFVIYQKGTDGKLHPFAESLSFQSMNQERFEQVFKAVREVISKEATLSGAEIENELAAYY